jgi:hypothetical protein
MMTFPIVYPKTDYPNHSLQIEGWTDNNKVVPSGSEVVILNEGDNNIRLSIPGIAFTFDISKAKCKIVSNHPLKEWGFE